MSESEVWSVGRLLEWTSGFLKQRGAESPRLDAELLLAHALKCARIDLYTRFTEVPDEPTRTTFRDLVRRRSEGSPVAYLLGRREFFSLSFRVTSDVLIPRPETEFLLIRLLDLVKESQLAEPSIVDVGTGSGILAVCAAKNIPRARVAAVDLSPAALKIAQENAREHKVEERISWHEGDLLNGFPSEEQFDFIVSNPPYVKTAEMAQLARDVREFEPRMALESGPRGTEIIERLIPQAADRLRPAGRLLMEISPMIHAEVLDLLGREPRFEILPSLKDAAGHLRVVQAKKRSG